MAVCVCRVRGPTKTLERPSANAIKIISYNKEVLDKDFGNVNN